MTSKYASFFEITNTEATCLVDNCGKVLRRKGARSSTSGMRRHLERKHEIVVDEAPVSNTQKAVVTCFIHHDIPLSVLACNCYRNMMKETDEPPGIESAKTCISTLFRNQKKQNIAKLEGICEICLILDHWSSVAVHSYIGVILQFITPNFEFKSMVLEFCRSCDHSENASVQEVLRILEEYGVSPNSISGAVGDATNSMKATLRGICAINGNEGIPHVCFAHVFQRSLVVSFVLPQISEIISRCTAFVTFVDKSPKFLDVIKATSISVGEETIFGTKPKPPVLTRWDSIYLMFESVEFQFSVLNEALENYQSECNAGDSALRLEGFPIILRKQIKALSELLFHFYNATQLVQSSKESIAMLIPFCIEILSICKENTVAGTQNFIAEFCIKLFKEFSSRIENHRTEPDDFVIDAIITGEFESYEFRDNSTTSSMDIIRTMTQESSIDTTTHETTEQSVEISTSQNNYEDLTIGELRMEISRRGETFKSTRRLELINFLNSLTRNESTSETSETSDDRSNSFQFNYIEDNHSGIGEIKTVIESFDWKAIYIAAIFFNPVSYSKVIDTIGPYTLECWKNIFVEYCESYWSRREPPRVVSGAKRKKRSKKGISEFMSTRRNDGNECETRIPRDMTEEINSFWPTLQNSNDTDPVVFWKKNCKRFRYLTPVAAKILAISLASAEAERLFSSSGRTISKCRANLGEKTAREMVILKVNEINHQFK